MWKTVFQLEWTLLRRDRSALVVLTIFTLFVLISAAVGGGYVDALNSGFSRSQTAETKRYATLESTLEQLHRSDAPAQGKDPRDPVFMGQDGAARLVVLPPAPLAAVALGQRDLLPQAMRVNTDVHITAARETETPMAGPTRLMTGAFDLAFVFVVLFPLVVIALSYELLSGERERGTLAMLLSQPVSQGGLVLGKALARGAALSLVTLVFVSLGLLFAGVSLDTASAWIAGALLMTLLVAWALFWFSGAVFVNALGQTSANNALTLVGAWLVLVVIVPGLSQVAVDTIYPPPSSVHLLHEAREASQEVESKLAGLVGTHEKKPKASDFAERVVEMQTELAKKTEPIREAAHAEEARRYALIDWLKFLSPAALLQSALEDLAGSSVHRHGHFESQADEFHARYRTFFFDLIKGKRALTPQRFSEIPSFSYREQPDEVVAKRSALAIAVLVGLALALLSLAAPRLRHIGRLTR